MHYATGTGKFIPKFKSIPRLTVELVSSPSYEDPSVVVFSSGCGTVKDFNVHLRAKDKDKELEAGDYVFNYKAIEQVT